MDLDFEKALTYIAKDSQWGNKLLAGSGLILASFAVFIFPLFMMLTGSMPVVLMSCVFSMLCALVIWIAITGYICETVKRRIEEPENASLPDWQNFGGLILTGMKYFAGYLIYFVPLLFLCLIFLSFVAFTMAATANGFSGVDLFTFLFMVLLGSVVLFVYCLTMIFLPLMMANFFRNQKVLSFVNFKEAFALLKNNITNYLILILLYIALCMLVQFAASILFVVVVGIILLPVLYFYLYLVTAELNAQFINSARKNNLGSEKIKPENESSENNEASENNENPSC